MMNTAFVFIKPHAMTSKVKELISHVFDKKGFAIVKEGFITGPDISKKRCAEKHYQYIASKATLAAPENDKFKEKFGVDWEEAMKAGRTLSAQEACEQFRIDADGLNRMWSAAQEKGDVVEIAQGLHLGRLAAPDGNGAFYVVNGFFLAVRSQFVGGGAGAGIHYYSVEWDKSACSWGKFLDNVVGASDPSRAYKNSLRGHFLRKWKDLGLESRPTLDNNCIHASASPLEALVDRMNWLCLRVDQDTFGKELLKKGIKARLVKEWMSDPTVVDQLARTNADVCLDVCRTLAGLGPLDVDTQKLEEEERREQEEALEALVLQLQEEEPRGNSSKKRKPKRKAAVKRPAIEAAQTPPTAVALPLRNEAAQVEDVAEVPRPAPTRSRPQHFVIAGADTDGEDVASDASRTDARRFPSVASQPNVVLPQPQLESQGQNSVMQSQESEAEHAIDTKSNIDTALHAPDSGEEAAVPARADGEPQMVEDVASDASRTDAQRFPSVASQPNAVLPQPQLESQGQNSVMQAEESEAEHAIDTESNVDIALDAPDSGEEAAIPARADGFGREPQLVEDVASDASRTDAQRFPSVSSQPNAVLPQPQLESQGQISVMQSEESEADHAIDTESNVDTALDAPDSGEEAAGPARADGFGREPQLVEEAPTFYWAPFTPFPGDSAHSADGLQAMGAPTWEAPWSAQQVQEQLRWALWREHLLGQQLEAAHSRIRELEVAAAEWYPEHGPIRFLECLVIISSLRFTPVFSVRIGHGVAY